MTVQDTRGARYELSIFVGPAPDDEVEALADAIMELPEFKAVHGGAVGLEKLVCVCGEPLIVCSCGDDRCPKCDPQDCGARVTVQDTRRYSTIVADPPWAYPGGVSAGGTPGKPITSYELPYEGMALADIKAIDVQSLASDDCWLALWTTNRYLAHAFDVLDAWGFGYRQCLVWHKLGPSPFGGTWAPNGAEFMLAAARGNPPVKARWPEPSVITTNRMGAGSHSRKPEVWLDLIEHCCPGPYLEMFARRNRLGWDTWGNEALEHVQIGGAA